MKKWIRPLASLAALAVFLIIAWATGSTNTSVQLKECRILDAPETQPDLFITFNAKRPNGEAIPGLTGSIFLTRQVVQDTAGCKSLIVSQNTIPLTTNEFGNFQYTGPAYTNFNTADLWRIEVNVPARPGVYEQFRKMLIIPGLNLGFASFEFISPTPL